MRVFATFENSTETHFPLMKTRKMHFADSNYIFLKFEFENLLLSILKS